MGILAGLGRRMTDPERERRRRSGAAGWSAQICGRCGRDLRPDEPVWRIRMTLGRALTGWSWTVAPVCATCGKSDFRSYLSGACETCERLVHYEWTRREFIRRHIFCSEVCRNGYYNRLARTRRAKARHKVCTVCSNTFMATRRDAITCGSVCRQKAYRARVTARKGVTMRDKPLGRV